MTDLTDRAMLASLSIRQWSARKFDRKITDKVNQEHGAAQDAGRYNKSLVAKDALSAITAVVSQARDTFYRLTLPWDDNGWRIMPATTYMQATEELRQLQARFEVAVDDFAAVYPGYVQQAAIDLNGMYDPNDYPPVSEIARKFGFAVGFQPMPSRQDFRVSPGHEHEAAVRQAIEDCGSAWRTPCAT